MNASCRAGYELRHGGFKVDGRREVRHSRSPSRPVFLSSMPTCLVLFSSREFSDRLFTQRKGQEGYVVLILGIRRRWVASRVLNFQHSRREMNHPSGIYLNRVDETIRQPAGRNRYC